MSATILRDLMEALQTLAGDQESNNEFGFVKPDTNKTSVGGGTQYVFVSREFVGDACWYTLDENSKPVPAPTTCLRGTLSSIYQVDTVRGNKGQYKATKMHLVINTPDTTYVLENGVDTILSQSIASSILFGNVQPGDTITIMVEPADQNEKVVFASVITADGNKIFPPREFARQGSVAAAQQALGCVTPKKKEYDKPYTPAGKSQPTGLAPIPVTMNAEPDYDDIPF
jgi:hypothetical protein